MRVTTEQIQNFRNKNQGRPVQGLSEEEYIHFRLLEEKWVDDEATEAETLEYERLDALRKFDNEEDLGE